MPAYYSYRRRYRRYRPRRYVRRWFKRRFRRYVNGSSKSTLRVKTAVEYTGQLDSGHGNTLGPVGTIKCFRPAPTASPAPYVLSSPLYRTYCNLYEEVKCIGMKINLSISSIVGNATLPSLQIYTAWDRRSGASEAPYTSDEIKNSSTYNVATALNNNVAKLTRSLYASDLMEKAQWHDCSYSTVGSNYQDDAYVSSAANPNFFSPAFYFCFGSPSLAASVSVNYTISVVYYMAFRNPKFGAGSSGTKLIDEGPRSVLSRGPDADGDVDDDMAVEQEDLDDAGDMDDGPAVSAATAASSSSSSSSSAVSPLKRAKPPTKGSSPLGKQQHTTSSSLNF